VLDFEPLMDYKKQSNFLNYIGGEWVPSSSGQLFINTNPADESDVVGHFQLSNEADAIKAVKAASQAFLVWKKTPISKKVSILNSAAQYLENHAAEFAIELTREEGKPVGQAKDEILRSAQTIRFYAVEGLSFTGETFPQDDPQMSVYTVREPLGVVTVIAPWNFPISIPARKIAPALVAGNTVVFKPSSESPLIGLRLVEAFVAAGIPSGVINFITGNSSAVGPVITRSPDVRAISFTGSTKVGEEIHRNAHLTTRTQMELGGKNPLIVMEDADLDLAVDLTIKGGLSLSGQACTGTSRVLVMKQVQEEFTNKLVSKVKALKIGNGLNSGAEIGPLASAKQLSSVLKYIEIGKKEATLLTGGERLVGSEFDRGYFVSPAIFTDVTQSMEIARKEIFGPVISIISIDSFDDAIDKANDTEYGLSAAIATKSGVYAHRFIDEIQSGTAKVNRTTTGNLINAPFGGIKSSSTSTFRESGRGGLEFYTQIKTVYRGY
jgi:aldehyde dehydrogenase (NAD+)